MKILQTATITIAIVLMIIVSPMTYSTLSFAARTNSTGTGTLHNNSTASSPSTPPSKIPNINPPKITATNPVAHNATTLMGSGGGHDCSGTDKFLWNHVYGASGNGKEPWNAPGPNHPSLKSRLTQGETSDGKKPPCITVTGTVYSAVGSGTRDDPDGDGDLHFTLALDPAFTKYSVPNDCNPSKTGCTNIIVEVICHTQPLAKYITTWTDYCAGVPSKYPPKAFPRQGERLSVSGTFVNDDGKWNEIHPASDIHPFK